MKQSTSLESLCSGLPQEFITIVSYVRDLKFTQRPDYDYMRKLFSNLYTKKGYGTKGHDSYNVYKFDWMKIDSNQYTNQTQW